MNVEGIGQRLKHAWNAFIGRDPTLFHDYGTSYSRNPEAIYFGRGNEKTIVASVYNKIALDVSAIQIRHVRLNENGKFKEYINSSLDERFNFSANIDQTGRAFIHDVVASLFDEGCVAIVPVDTDIDPNDKGSYKILSFRTGRILEWFPKHVRLEVYNENKGYKEEIIMSKNVVAIIENPLYAVVNAPNSTMKRLTRKLALLDRIDEQSGSGKFNMIVQLPYSVRNAMKREKAEESRQSVEEQLSTSKYGIAYIDSTEKITQLNRPLENNLMGQVEYLTNLLYSQLGITTTIMDGTANEETMLNYYNRTIEPILSAITDECKRKFLTTTAISQKQSIMFFRDAFKLVPVNQLAEIADKFTRNEILTSNEVRSIVGMKPSEEPNADELRNKNLSQPTNVNDKLQNIEKEEENQNE